VNLTVSVGTLHTPPGDVDRCRRPERLGRCPNCLQFVHIATNDGAAGEEVVDAAGIARCPKEQGHVATLLYEQARDTCTHKTAGTGEENSVHEHMDG
jgi:hypothetical protein